MCQRGIENPIQPETLIQVLRKLRFSSTLPEAVLTNLAASASAHQFPAGAVLFRENAENNQLMLLYSGRVALEIHVPDRGNLRILELEPGDVIGWSALLDNGKMTTSAVTMEPSKIIAFDGKELLAACEADHAFGYVLMHRVALALADRLLDTRSQLLNVLTFEQAISIDPKPQR